MSQFGRVGFVLLFLPTFAQAQFRPGVTGGAFAGSRSTLHLRTPNVSINVNRVTVFRQFGGGYFVGNPFLPVYATGYSPFFGFPSYYGGFNPYLGYSNLGPIVTPPIVVDSQPQPGPGPDPAPPPAAAKPAARGGAMPGAPAGKFRPVGQAERDRALRPVAPEPAPPPRPAPPDPRNELDSLVRDGKRAFAAGDYGRSAELFRQAIATGPEPFEAEFFLAQSLFALGKYSDAVATITKALVRQPDWPTMGPSIRDLYSGKVEQLSEHRRQLDEAAAANPGDAALQFLQAYVRWFDGEREDAKAIFRKLRDRVSNADAITRFVGE